MQFAVYKKMNEDLLINIVKKGKRRKKIIYLTFYFYYAVWHRNCKFF